MWIRILLYSLALIAIAPDVACTARELGGSTPMQDGFSWVIEDQLAGMSQPGAFTSLDEDAEFLAEQGIDLLISLTGGVPNPEVLANFGIESHHIPVEDFYPPTLAQQVDFVEKTAQTLEGGGRVGVHCAAGIGRTGTMLATYLVFLGSSPDDAIERVRQLRPGSIETAAQEQAIREYYEYLRRD